MAPPVREIKVRLLERRAIVGDCWEWDGACDKDGYGVMGIKRGKQYRVPRVSYTEFVGEIPEGMLVCHKCDNRKCFNPDHLFIGSPRDNTLDMVSKGRKASKRGSGHKMSKLVEKDVVDIRNARSSGESLASLASRFGVTFQHISNIAKRKTWRHI